MQHLFKTKDICELATLPQTTLAEWTQKEIVKPVVDGIRGRGRADEFSVMQAIGILVGRAHQQSWWGCSLQAVGMITAAFAAMTEEQLLKEFAKKRTHFCTLHQGRPILAPKKYDDWINVQEIYERVKHHAETH